SGLRTIMPFGILLAALIGLVVLAVRKTLGSVNRLTTELDARSESDLRPLDIAAAPHEIKPFLLSINRLLQRLGRAPTQSLHR
ncbi:MAG: histidine kinase, partial [Burkholderiales bacterium]|nr:histidine kinase [Burkholderiales bacterium]